MSGAAYRRGSALITRQICSEYGCPGCINCREHKPIPRPADWGAKAMERAMSIARSIVASARGYGIEDPTVEVLSTAVRDRARVGASTAKRAAEIAIAETPSGPGE
jgi:hypothetical protein